MEASWRSELSVGERMIDKQHKSLLEHLDRLVSILSSLDVNIGQLRETLHFLHTYIKEHFAYEEDYMERNSYPGLESHRKIHQGFVRFYLSLQKRLIEKSSSPNFSSVDIRELLEEAKNYLSSWVNHIEVEDRKYAEYINKKKREK